MNTLYDSLQTVQGVTFLDDVMFTGSQFLPNADSLPINVPVPITLLPPTGFINPLIGTNQGPGAQQLFLFLRLLNVALNSSPQIGSFVLQSENATRQYGISQFITSLNVPANATGNVQTFTFGGNSSSYTNISAKANILTRTQFFVNANINVTKVEISDDGVSFDNINAAPGVLSSILVTDYIGVYGSPGYFRPNNNGIILRITVNNTAASTQTYSFAAFGSFDITEYVLLSLQYQDVAGTPHQLAYLDTKLSTQNVPLNMLIQSPIQATTNNFGNLLVIPKFRYSPLNGNMALSYTLTATFAYMKLG